MEYYSFSTEYGAADELFKAVLSLDKERVSELRAEGVALSEDVKRVLVNGGGPMVSNKPETRLWYLYLIDIKGIDAADFVYISREFYRETGAALYYSETVGDAMWGKFFSAEVFKCFLDCYDQTKMNKTRLMRGAIDSNSVECLAICAENGWLRMPRKRDEMIEYSQKNGRTECTAFLLEFKNKNFDLAEERKKAEKKIERELNASPNSVSELKKIWSYKKREDGSLMITNYKGDQTRISVPARIGKSAVTAIGKEAFSPGGIYHRRDFFKTITEVTLPDSIVEIGEMAFNECAALRAVNIPEGVSEIKNHTFAHCFALESIVIPSSVKAIGDFALFGCETLKTLVIPEGVESIGKLATCQCRSLETVELPRSLIAVTEGKSASDSLFYFSPKLKNVIVPQGSYAEKYCTKNNIAYKYKEDEQ